MATPNRRANGINYQEKNQGSSTSNRNNNQKQTRLGESSNETSPNDILNDYYINNLSPPPPPPPLVGASANRHLPRPFDRSRSADNLSTGFGNISIADRSYQSSPSAPPPVLPKPNQQPAAAAAGVKHPVKLPPPPPPIAVVGNKSIPVYTQKSPTSPTKPQLAEPFGNYSPDQLRRAQSDLMLTNPPEEIDFTLNQVEFEREQQEERRFRTELRNRQSVMINFEPANAKDYGSTDNLLNDLAMIIKRNNQAAGNILIKRPMDSKLHRQAGAIDHQPPQISKPSYFPVPTAPSSSSSATGGRVPILQQPAFRAPAHVHHESTREERPAVGVLAPTILAPHGVETASQSFSAVELDNHSTVSDSIPLANLLNNPEAVKDERVREALIKLAEANIKKITTRIFIENSQTFRTVNITSLMSARDVINETVHKGRLEESENWALFEVIEEMGIERPLRDFEIVTDVLATWGWESTNALVMKKYGFPESLTVEAAREGYPQICGWLYVEVKPGKWIHRFCELTSSGVYYSKDAKGTGETQLSLLSSSDVYTMIRTKKNVPTKFCFAIKRQEPPHTFEHIEDSVKYLCADHLEKNKDWVLTMRCAKGRKILAEAEKRKSGSNPNSAHSSINSNSQNALLKKSTSANQLATQSSTTVPPVPPIPPPFQKTSFSPSSSASSLNRSKQRKQNGNSDDERPIGAALIDRKQSIENGRTSSSSPLSGGSSNDKITRKYGQRLITPEVTADQRLVDVIDRYKGNPQDNGEIVNKTRFGENGQPLVPLTLQEIAANPAVDLSKYQMKRKNSKKQQAQPCATCSCTDFAKSHFNEAKCANCFHIH